MSETPEPNRGRNGSPGVTLDELFEILSLGRRRTILYCLTAQHDGTIDFQGLVDAVAASEGETERQRRTWAPQRQRVATALHHDDLPRLVEAGLVDYNHWSGEVQYNRAERLDDWLASARATDRENENEDEPEHRPLPK